MLSYIKFLPIDLLTEIKSSKFEIKSSYILQILQSYPNIYMHKKVN